MSSVSPATGATDVALNTTVAATFSEPLSTGTVSGASFSLVAESGTTVTGTVTLSGTTATFTPQANLTGNTRYTATISGTVRDAAGNALATSYVWSFTTGAEADVTPPTVTGTSPLNGAPGVAFNTTVSATFSEPMTVATLTTTSFTVAATGSAPVAGAVTVSGTTAAFRPAADLAPGTLYTASITTAARDAAGNALASNYIWTFTTGSTPDITPPTVTATSPTNGATGVSRSTPVSATFSEDMGEASLTTASVTLAPTAGGAAIAGTVAVTGTTVATFTPSAILAGSTQFTATITTAATDAAGNALAGNYTWTFTTAAAPDVTPPTVIAVTPANASAGVSRSTPVSATFSEPMTNATLTPSSITLAPTAGGAAVTGSVSVSGNTATFTPSAILAGSTQFTATVTTAAKDAAGNALASNFTWTFTTVAAPDVTPPTITGNTPANGATGVALNTAPTVTFSESMQNATITTSSFTLVTTSGGVAVPGSVTVAGNTATYTPSASLAGSTQFTATVTTAVKDAAGNALVANTSWTFTTGAAPDVTPPTVISVAPANAATGVSRTTTVSATFSEPMQNATLTTASVTLATTTGGVAIAGTVSVSGNTATITPSATLAGSTQFTATITTAAKDVAGNALASNFTWTFTTAPAPDVTPPTITGNTPANGATGVALNTAPTVTFSEPMQNATITTASFTLVTTSGGVAVPGTVSISGNTATYTPNAGLAGSTQYTATVTTAVKDVAGNSLAANTSWSFTTTAPADVTPPTVTTRVPASGATAVSVGTTVSAAFSEPMQNATLTTASFTLVRTAGSQSVAGSVSVAGNTATFTPAASLAAGTQYTATVTTAARDVAGNPLAANVTWSFTTASGGGSSTTGVHALSFKMDGTSGTVATASRTTQATGSSIVVCVGRGVVSAHAAPIDNKSSTYTQIGQSQTYSNAPTSGTACYIATNVTGGSAHVVTAPVSPSATLDKTTLAAVEVIGGGRVQDFKWNERLILQTPYTSLSVTTTGPATLVAVWWGDRGQSSSHFATPDNGFTVIESLLSAGNLVQVAVATKNVATAGTYNVTWTSNEGAQLWLIAIQP